MSILSRLVVLLEAEIGGFEGDMGKAVRIAEQKSKQIERSAKGAGKAVSEIGYALSNTNFGGLDKLTEGSKTATAAIKGLGASIALIGYASWPVLAIVAAAGALGYFATQAGDADREAEELGKRLDKLRESAVDLAAAPIRADATAAQGQIDRIKGQIQDRREQIAFLARNSPNEDISKNPIAQQLEREIAELEKEIPIWTTRFQGAIDKIVDIKRKESERLAGKGGADAGDKILKMPTLEVRPSPELQAELDNIALAKRLAEEARTPYDRLFERMQDIERAATALSDTGEPILDADAAARLKQEALDDYLREIAKSAGDAATAVKKVGEQPAKAADTWSVFGEQAARNIQDITASLIKGEQSGRSFFGTMLSGLRDIAAELAAQQLLRALFSGFQGSGGLLGAFADAVLKPRASGGPVSAGKPYLVGDRVDRMPEVFVPATSGSIQPLGGGGGATFNVAIDASGSTDPVAVYENVARAFGAFEKRLARKLQRGQLVPAGG